MQSHPQPIHRVRGLSRALALLGLAAAAAAAPAGASAHPGEDAGAVYVLSNQAAGNAVVVYGRDEAGRLRYEGSVPTGGRGTITPPPPNGAPGIDPLGSQGAIVYRDGLLLAVNAGSNDVSLFSADEHGLRLLDRAPSGGILPVSLAVSGDVVLVANGGGTPNVTSLRLDRRHGRLVPIADGSTLLPGGTGAAPGEVDVAPDGDTVVVTEKGTNLIDTFRLRDDGRTVLRASTASVGNTPFGFGIGRHGVVAVVDAAAGAASSYQIAGGGALRTVTGALSLDGQQAPCWLVETRDGRLAFTGNAGTQAISALSISERGELALLAAAAATTNGAALDLGLSPDDRFLYARSANGADAAAAGSVSAFRVHHDGRLTAIDTVSDVPPGAQGLAVR
jgi:6-phosphogluconolactonase (cycloisomerase 2 family)